MASLTASGSTRYEHSQRRAASAPSRHPIWFRADGFHGADTHLVDCVWLSRRRGRTVASIGSYPLAPRGVRYEQWRGLDPVEIIGVMDTRYGPSWECSWDGVVFRTAPGDRHPDGTLRPVHTLEDNARTRSMLSDILDDPDAWFADPGRAGEWLGPYVLAKR